MIVWAKIKGFHTGIFIYDEGAGVVKACDAFSTPQCPWESARSLTGVFINPMPVWLARDRFWLCWLSSEGLEPFSLTMVSWLIDTETILIFLHTYAGKRGVIYTSSPLYFINLSNLLSSLSLAAGTLCFFLVSHPLIVFASAQCFRLCSVIGPVDLPP